MTMYFIKVGANTAENEPRKESKKGDHLKDFVGHDRGAPGV